MSSRYAVLIGSSIFPEESKLNDLRCPVKDVEGLYDVLSSPERGNFTEVNILRNEPFYKVIREVQRTFNKAGKEDMVLLYYSGHGKLNRDGKLHLTTPDTFIDELESTSISVNRIRELIDVSSCRKVVIILDCCFGGAVGKIFTKGSIDDQLQASGGQGTYIITASTEIQVAEEKEGDEYSVFTKNLINGIVSGDADLNGDGLITLDELYDHVFRTVSHESPQKPTKWGIDLRGEIVLAKSGKSPRSERRIKIKKLLMHWANDESIPDSILADALHILKIPLDQLSNEQKAYDTLMDKVLTGNLRPGDFVYDWTLIEASSKTTNREVPVSSEMKKKTIEEVSQPMDRLPDHYDEISSKKKDDETRRLKEDREKSRKTEETERGAKERIKREVHKVKNDGHLLADNSITKVRKEEGQLSVFHVGHESLTIDLKKTLRQWIIYYTAAQIIAGIIQYLFYYNYY